jgi:molybdenum cofactor cytidylyltransferase
VIGVPSCARSPKVNGFDWVLQRLLAKLSVSGADIARMGAGGLLKEIPSRPTPREGSAAAAPRAPSIGAIVLAAGQSRRMGSVNKLLETVGDAPMVRRVVQNVLASDVAETVVVLGHEAERVREALAGLDVRFVVNADYAQGLSTSLKAGLEALAESRDGAIVCLGDMPLVAPRHVDRLIAAFDPVEGRGICVPVVEGKRGNPVLWARGYFAEMMEVQGDVGARHLLGQFADDVCEVDMGDRAVMTDIDTPEALKAVIEAAH